MVCLYFVPRRFAVRVLVPVFFVAVRAGFAVLVVRVVVFLTEVRFCLRLTAIVVPFGFCAFVGVIADYQRVVDIP